MRIKTFRTPLPLPSNQKVTGCKWVFKIKRDLAGLVQQYKSCLIAKGYDQKVGFDFHRTFNLEVKLTTIKVFLSMALSRGWSLR